MHDVHAEPGGGDDGEREKYYFKDTITLIFNFIEFNIILKKKKRKTEAFEAALSDCRAEEHFSG